MKLCRKRLWIVVTFLLLAVLHAPPAHAYVGPGAGFAFVTSFFLLLSTTFLVFLALLSWPVRLVWRLIRRRRPPKPSQVDRVVVLGLDGVDPARLRRLMEEGALPNFERVKEMGGFGELATTCPAMSPVAWSTFATGVDPSRHGIFDFLAPSRQSYRPRLSSSEVLPPRRQLRLGGLQLPLSKPRLRSLRRAVPFWNILSRFGVRCNVLRVPITFPPDRFDGTMLSAMCAPDLLGTQGTFTYYTTDEAEGERIGGRVIQIALDERGEVRTRLPGPQNPLRRAEKPLSLPLRLSRLDREKGTAQLRVGSERRALEVGKHTDWVPLRFPALPGIAVHGICRFRLASVEPLRLYVTPINIDPRRPSLPIGHPFVFSVFLGKLLGPYATLGLAEDTWALNEGAIDEQGFWDQVSLCQDERERMFFEMLRRTRRGVLACVFDGTDRAQHMFLRAPPESPFADAVDRVYRQADDLLGRLLDRVDFKNPRNLLLVLSDHGFAPFERGVNLNTWLIREGYMALEPGREAPGKNLEGVDWSRTRAYAIGLSGIYLNLEGREAQGTVKKAEAADLLVELKKGLEQLEDTKQTNTPPVRRALITRALYRGPFLDDAPDLIVGYSRGYRASWATAQGGGGSEVVEPNRRAWGGDHCIDPELVPGILLSNRRLRFEGAAIGDIAPTLLELHGVPPPEHMTGRSLLEVSS
jgi:predicted AlkP superfamily phosphohydrolase/phosphomutase